MKNLTLIYGINFLIFLFFVSCEISTTPGAQENELRIKTNLPPTSITLESSADTITLWDSLNLTCTVEDPENDPLSYEWTSYRITANSTLENYEIIKLSYWLNQGEFILYGKDAIWKPGKLEAKHLIVCNVQDKAGYEITAKKVVQVVSAGTVSVLTDKITYRVTDFDTVYHNIFWPHLNFTYMVKNALEIKANLYGCGSNITPGVQKKEDNQWIESIKPDGCTSALMPADGLRPEFIRFELFAGEEVQDSLWSPYLGWHTFDPGQYRLFITSSLGPYLGGALTDTLYSNEFELIK